MRLKELLQGLDVLNFDSFRSKKTNIDIEGMAYDHRKVQQNFLFCALVGDKIDGHQFIPQAIEAGATAILCQNDSLRWKYRQIPFIKVTDSRHSMAIMAHNFYGNPAQSMRIMGITGTNGKTTITFLIANMVKNCGARIGIIGTTGIYYNDKFIPATHTTPESLELAEILSKMKEEDIDTVIMEVSSHSLVQHRTAGINFYAALFTNLTHEHLDYHRSMAQYAAAKKILYDNLPIKSIALAVDVSDYTKFILKDCRALKKLQIGYKAESDIIISDIELNLNYSKFKLTFNHLENKPTQEFRTNLIGKFNVENAALAVSYLVANGVNRRIAGEVLAEADGAPGRMDRIPLSNAAIAVVDYAHTPDALEKALSACKELLSKKPENKLICVFGCGGDRDKTKRPEMGKISTDIADITIITDDNPRTEDSSEIRKEIINGIDNPKAIYHEISPREDAIKKAKELSQRGDIILIAGKGHENYQIIGTEKQHFDDKEIVSKL